MRLSRRIFLYFTIVVVISIASVGFFSYRISSVQLEKQTEQRLQEIVSNAVHQTDSYLRMYERFTLTLLMNPDLKAFLDRPPLDDYDYYELNHQLRSTVVDPIFVRNPEVTAVYLVDYEGRGLYFTSTDVNEIYEPYTRDQVDGFRKLVSEQGKLTVLHTSIYPGKSDQFITLARKVRGQQSPAYKGILGIEIKSEDLAALWGGIDLGPNGFFMITDLLGRVIYHPDSRQLGSTVDGRLLQQLASDGTHSFAWKSGDQPTQLYVSQQSDYTGWNLSVSIPLDQVRAPIASIRYSSFSVGVLTLLLVLWISARFGRSIARPIQILKDGMTQTKQGNWQRLPQLDRKDELDELIRSYNLMVAQLSDLMDDVVRAEVRRKDAELERGRAELQSLQLQINPHFLYNTLESVICYAVILKSDEITEMIGALSQMFRYSVRTEIEETAVVNELKHVLSFMTIMKHRIGREFELDVRMTPAFFLKKMVRLTLQPLIENVFQHAFVNGIEEHHSIWLGARQTESGIEIIVEDNGCGMSIEKLGELRMRLDQNRLAEKTEGKPMLRKGIGLMNVHRRIQLVFGEQYGIAIDSSPGVGTKVSILLPDVETGHDQGRDTTDFYRSAGSVHL